MQIRCNGVYQNNRYEIKFMGKIFRRCLHQYFCCMQPNYSTFSRFDAGLHLLLKCKLVYQYKWPIQALVLIIKCNTWIPSNIRIVLNNKRLTVGNTQIGPQYMAMHVVKQQKCHIFYSHSQHVTLCTIWIFFSCCPKCCRGIYMILSHVHLSWGAVEFL